MKPPPAAEAASLRIYGRVQGVSFRVAMQREALSLGLRGWVRNRTDGSVEALALGEASAIARLQAWAAHGPPGARVDRLISGPVPDPQGDAAKFLTFEVLVTR